MAYDKKLLAAARRELERERTAHTEELEARRRQFVFYRDQLLTPVDAKAARHVALADLEKIDQRSDINKPAFDQFLDTLGIGAIGGTT